MVGFVRILYGFFGKGLEAPGKGGGSGPSRAAAPDGACLLAGMGLHRVTFSSAGHGLSTDSQTRLINTRYV